MFMLIMLGLPWWMLGDEFIDIPSFGWVETNPSDDNYDYYRKTITTVFFVVVPPGARSWFLSSPTTTSHGWPISRWRRRCAWIAGARGAKVFQMEVFENGAPKWLVSDPLELMLMFWPFPKVCLRKGCTHVYPMQIRYQNMTQQWTFRGTLFPDEPKLDFQEWSGTVAASQRLVQLDRS